MSISRISFSLLALPLITIAPAGMRQEKKITFSAPAATADHLLIDLSKATGVNLHAAATTAKDVLLISVKDVTLADLMAKIAATEDASWETDGSGYRLNRTPAQRRMDEQREIKTLSDRYAKDLAKIAASANELKPMTTASAEGIVSRAKEAEAKMQDGSGWQIMTQLTGQSPAGRLMDRLLANFSATDLAAIPENGKMVFSDLPNRVQRRIPGSPAKAVDLFVAEQRMLSQAAGTPTENESYYQMRTMTAALKMRPAKVLIAVSRRPLEGSLNCSLEILDANDHVLGTANKNVGNSALETGMKDIMEKPAKGATPLKLSEDAAALRSVFKNLNGIGSASTVQLSEELRKKIADPTKYDPLGFAPSDALTGYAQLKGVNLVAALNDTTMVASFPFGDGDLMPAQVPFFLGMASEEIVTTDGWMTVSPLLPMSSRNSRCDREALGRLMKTMVTKSSLTLDDASAYALSSPGVQMDVVAMLWTAAFDPTALTVFEQNGMAALRFYGSVSQGQRTAFINHQEVPLASLSLGQRDALSEMVYGMDSRLNSSDVAARSGEEYIMPTSEPTELLPNGWAPQGTFKLTPTETYVVIPYTAAGNIRMGDSGMDANSLAWRVYSQQNPNTNNAWASNPQNQIALDKLMPASRLTVQMHFTLAPTVALDKQLTQLSSRTKPVSFAELPAEFRKAYNEAYAQQKKMAENGGGYSPPVQASPPLPN